MHPNTIAAFWARVAKSDGCWLWQGALSDGYGIFTSGGEKTKAHRWAWMIEYGPIPDGMYVCHRCDVLYPPDSALYRSCVRPDHLFLGTALDNTRDCIAKGRARKPGARGDRHWTHTHPELIRRGDQAWTNIHPESIARGEHHGRAKLTTANVAHIRQAVREGTPRKALAATYGVSVAAVDLIVTRRTWAHLP